MANKKLSPHFRTRLWIAALVFFALGNIKGYWWTEMSGCFFMVWYGMTEDADG